MTDDRATLLHMEQEEAQGKEGWGGDWTQSIKCTQDAEMAVHAGPSHWARRRWSSDPPGGDGARFIFRGRKTS